MVKSQERGPSMVKYLKKRSINGEVSQGRGPSMVKSLKKEVNQW